MAGRSRKSISWYDIYSVAKKSEAGRSPAVDAPKRKDPSFGRFLEGGTVNELDNDGKPRWWSRPLVNAIPGIRNREEQVFLVLTLVIGALTGLAVVAFIVLTEHLGMRLYPVGSAAWRRVLVPVLGSVGMGYFPDARGSRVPGVPIGRRFRGCHA